MEYAKLVAYLKRCRELHYPAATSLARIAADANAYCNGFGLPVLDLPYEADGAAIDAHREARAAKRDTPAYRAAQERKARSTAEREAQKAIALQAQLKSEADEWIKGERIYLAHGYPDTLLRVNGDQIETSRGARFPLEHAKLAFRVVARQKDRGEAWHRNGATVQLGSFHIDSISPEGDVHAGCHFVKWPAIEHAARVLGLVL
jgi:hypothetical protein